MILQKKYFKDFHITTSKLIMNKDLNASQALFGGLLVQWVDEAAAIFCMDVLKTNQVVTKKISEILYNHPARLGDILDFYFRVKQLGRTSITIETLVKTKVIQSNEIVKEILKCDMVFVKVNSLGQPEPHECQEEA